MYKDPFLKVDAKALLVTKHFLLQQLIHDTVFYEVCQLLLAFLNDATNTFENVLCSDIEKQIVGGKDNTFKPEQREILIEKYVEELEKLEEEARPYWEMLGKLLHISFVLERQRFTFHRLEKFHKNKKVAQYVHDVKNLFSKEITELKDLKNKPQFEKSHVTNDYASGRHI
jgi:hypothetical protein